MSYERTFNFSQSLKGADKTHKIYTLSLVPKPATRGAAESLFHAHFRSALVVEILSLQASITMPANANDKTSAYGGVAVIGVGTSITEANSLARGKALAVSGGLPMLADLASAIGINPVIKGIARDGALPNVSVGVYSDWDASGSVLAVLSLSLTVRFTGEANATGFDTPLSPAA